ncbi:signal peptidase I [Acinetobacter baumannii]|uniref:signal peptidase I n=1 Tax=Acinetobacter baumannii TaxID=470 RepID=UPI00258219DA|nr:signal peptidase I [Acinetobacter baumannii]EKU3442130.1 signal peptidase I [Acinetobacter baumannii]MDP7849617.1 signal peptidase I [Acinetobacter baumannii]
MKISFRQNKVYLFLAYLFMPLISFLRELFIACKGRRLTVLWIIAIFCFIYISSDYYVKKVKDNFGIAVDISNVSSNDHIFFKVNKGIKTYSELKVGEYISFSSSKLEPIVSSKSTIIKKVVAKQGDHIQIKGLELFINGVKRAELHPAALVKLKKTEAQMQADYIIPLNSVFVLGSYYRSFDSRYWGVLPIKENTKVDIATPILF